MRNSTKTQVFHSQIARCLCLLAFVLFLTCAFVPAEVQATDPTMISRGEQFQLSAVLLTNGTFGEPLSNQIVEFYDQTYDQYIGQAITDFQGVATITHQFSLSHPKGNTLLNATYRGNITLALSASCQYIPLIVTSTTSMSLSTSSFEYAPNDIIEISIDLRDDLNSPIQNATLDLYCDEIYLANASTNSEGKTMFSIDILNNSLSLGIHEIEVIYSGDVINYHRGVSDILEFEIKRISTSVSSQSPIPEISSLNHTLSLELEASSEEGKLPNSAITILIDGVPVDMVLTNESGFAFFEIRFDDSFSVGWHNLTLQYQGNLIYEASQVSYVFFLQSDFLIEIDYKNQVVLNTSTIVSVSISDIFNRSIPSVSVNISDYLTHYSESISASNSADVYFEFLVTGSIGNRTVWIVVDSIYSPVPVSISFVLSVWSSSSISVISSSIDGFASPNQSLQFTLHLSNQLANLSEREIVYSLIGSNETGVIVTNNEGISHLVISAPSIERTYELLLFFNGSRTLFELPISCSITFVVSSKIPVQVQDFEYVVDHLRKSVSVDMLIQASNGTTVEGIRIEMIWLENHFFVVSSDAGRIHLDLIIPNSAGLYSLEYQIVEMIGIASTSDIFHILISPFDSNASEGLGFFPLMFGITISFAVPILPILKKRAMFK